MAISWQLKQCAILRVASRSFVFKGISQHFRKYICFLEYNNKADTVITSVSCPSDWLVWLSIKAEMLNLSFKTTQKALIGSGVCLMEEITVSRFKVESTLTLYNFLQCKNKRIAYAHMCNCLWLSCKSLQVVSFKNHFHESTAHSSVVRPHVCINQPRSLDN